eukprot:COSAG01_NODE_3906_length_5559_cov_5.852381_1_plen_27_part_10
MSVSAEKAFCLLSPSRTWSQPAMQSAV